MRNVASGLVALAIELPPDLIGLCPRSVEATVLQTRTFRDIDYNIYWLDSG